MQLVKEEATFTFRGEEITIDLFLWLCNVSGHTFECGELIDWNMGEVYRSWREKRISRLLHKDI